MPVVRRSRIPYGSQAMSIQFLNQRSQSKIPSKLGSPHIPLVSPAKGYPVTQDGGRLNPVSTHTIAGFTAMICRPNRFEPRMFEYCAWVTHRCACSKHMIYTIDNPQLLVAAGSTKLSKCWWRQAQPSCWYQSDILPTLEIHD